MLHTAYRLSRFTAKLIITTAHADALVSILGTLFSVQCRLAFKFYTWPPTLSLRATVSEPARINPYSYDAQGCATGQTVSEC